MKALVPAILAAASSLQYPCPYFPGLIGTATAAVAPGVAIEALPAGTRLANVRDFAASGSSASTTGSIRAGSATLVLAAPLDFATGQGILVQHAGAAFAIPGPTDIAVAAQGTPGTTAYSYRVGSLDCAGGVGKAGDPVKIDNGNAVLGATFNLVRWTAAPGACGYVVWQSKAGADYVLEGETATTLFADKGPIARPSTVPALPTEAALADWLVTSIAAGGGTATLTLAAPAATAVTDAVVAHDDTAAVQAAIAAAQTSEPIGGVMGTAKTAVYLAPGNYIVCGLDLRRPVALIGAGNTASVLVIRSGCAAPAVTVSCTGDRIDYYAQQGIPCIIEINRLRIISPNRADAPGQGRAHAILLADAATDPVYTQVRLEDDTILGVPGDGIHAASWHGWILALDNTINYPGGYGIYANSVADWYIYNADIGGALEDNILLSGAYSMHFSNLSTEVAVKNNINVFGYTNAYFDNCFIDIAGENGVYANLRTDPVPGRLWITDCQFRWNSQSADGAYADLANAAGSAGTVYLKGDLFKSGKGNPTANAVAYNIHFDPTSTALVYADSATRFDYGPAAVAAKVVDVPARLVLEAAEAQSSPRSLVWGGDFGTNPWQHGTRFAGIGVIPTYTADGWFAYGGRASRIVVSKETGAMPAGFAAALRIARAPGTSDVAPICVAQEVPTAASIAAQGQNVTVSFAAMSGADFSAAGSNLSVRIVSGNGTSEGSSRLAAGTWTGASVQSFARTITPKWARSSVTAAIPAHATEIGLEFCAQPAGSAAAEDGFAITGIQMEIGDEPTRFVHLTDAAVRAQAQEIFECSYDIGTAPGAATGIGADAVGHITFATPKRDIPKITLYSPRSGALGKAYDAGRGKDVSSRAENIGRKGFSWRVSPAAKGRIDLQQQWCASAEP